MWCCHACCRRRHYHGHGHHSHDHHNHDYYYVDHGQFVHDHYDISGYDVMVSKDGRGNYTHVAEAIENAPNMSLTFYNIYIKEGTYEENLYIPDTKTNIRLYGDGARRTIIFGNRTNNETNGPTIAATFLDCLIYARYRGIVTYTAQGREHPTDKSGFLFQRCNFTMSPEDYGRKSEVKATFGRPWRAYSLVFIIESYIDSMLDPIGWLEFPGQPTDKLTYVEWCERINWPGVKAFHHLPELLHFTSENYPWISLSHNITWNLLS
ncbi:hypothetical protein RIF29_18336 [Crotalaria pallida]|uniref:Pectinesterase catalytic domain-containing protein n=1 Tax=Crotalaria pallida TaxID=3830 RepID=A0AAN9FPQ1_CROPI